jgi:hypothetical protein
MRTLNAIFRAVGLALFVLGAALVAFALSAPSVAYVLAVAGLAFILPTLCPSVPSDPKVLYVPGMRWDIKQKRWIIPEHSRPEAGCERCAFRGVACVEHGAMAAAVRDYLAADPLDPTATLGFLERVDRPVNPPGPPKPWDDAARVIPPTMVLRGLRELPGHRCDGCCTMQVVGSGREWRCCDGSCRPST